MNASMKQNIRRKADTYLKRAEEIKKTTEKIPPTKSSAPSNPPRRDDDNEDPDRKRMLQKFEGQFDYMYLSHINMIVSF
jgi:hypothetical protein